MTAMRNFLFVACMLLLGTPLYGADARPEVDLELVLAVDVSRSMDTDEQKLQRQGYVLGLKSPEVIKAIQSGALGRIAVTYVEWSGAGSAFVVIPWTIIEDLRTATNFSGALSEAPISRDSATSISWGITFAATLFGREFRGMKRTIDVSGDGPNNAGIPVEIARDEVVAKGIGINGLPLMLKTNDSQYGSVEDLDEYYTNCVIGGLGAFMIPVTGVEQFPIAIRRKLVLEIATKPRPDLEPPNLPIVFVNEARSNPYNCMIGEQLMRDRFTR